MNKEDKELINKIIEKMNTPLYKMSDKQLLEFEKELLKFKKIIEKKLNVYKNILYRLNIIIAIISKLNRILKD